MKATEQPTAPEFITITCCRIINGFQDSGTSHVRLSDIVAIHERSSSGGDHAIQVSLDGWFFPSSEDIVRIRAALGVK